MNDFLRGSTPLIVDDINVGVLLHTLGFRQARKATAVTKINGKLEFTFHFDETSIDGTKNRNDVVKCWYDSAWLNDPENAESDIVKAKFVNESRNQFLDEIKGSKESIEYCFLHNKKVYRDEMAEGDRVLTQVEFGDSYGFVDLSTDNYKKFNL